jgi:hypothetical protein
LALVKNQIGFWTFTCSGLAVFFYKILLIQLYSR